MAKNSQHVLTSDSGRWVVKKEGAVKASRSFSTQKDAIVYARDLARSQSGELYIHGRDGKISERVSYSGTTFPSKHRK